MVCSKNSVNEPWAPSRLTLPPLRLPIAPVPTAMKRPYRMPLSATNENHSRDGIYGVLGESVRRGRAAGGSGVDATVSGAARNASIT